jgi:hypothetical protein
MELLVFYHGVVEVYFNIDEADSAAPSTGDSRPVRRTGKKVPSAEAGAGSVLKTHQLVSVAHGYSGTAVQQNIICVVCDVDHEASIDRRHRIHLCRRGRARILGFRVFGPDPNDHTIFNEQGGDAS